MRVCHPGMLSDLNLYNELDRKVKMEEHLEGSREKDLLEEKVKKASSQFEEVFHEAGKVIVGQEHVGRRLMMAMVAQGHVLLEGLPGLAKTTAVKTIAEITALNFKRIQFTPDLLPADLVGTQIYDPRTAEFKVKQGPIFSNLVLADEINRAPAKVQSALLESMEERQVTIGSQTWELEEPFLVMATQNPVEQEGTYPLPEAQVDRFLFKVLITYPKPAEEEEIIRRAMQRREVSLQKLMTKQDIREYTKLSGEIYTSEKIRRYIVQLVHATRFPKASGMPDLENLIECGASPRASIAMDRVAKVNALFEGRSYVTPQDIKDIGYDILRHRIKPTYEAEAENIGSDEIINRIFERVDVP